MQSLKGGCFCGQVRFKISASQATSPIPDPPSGTAGVHPWQLRLTRGEDQLHTLTWGEAASWQECPSCRTRLFYRQPPGSEVYVQWGALRGSRPDWLVVGPAPTRPVRLFHQAAQRGRWAQMRRFLASGVAVDAELAGQTALELAAHRGHLAMVRLLLSFGADARRALRHLCWDVPADRIGPLFRLLLAHGYPPQDLLIRALDRDSPEGLDLLLQYPCDLNQLDPQGRTLLERACHSPALLRRLLRAGAEVHLQGAQGTQALARCAYFGWTRQVRVLLEGGFPPDLPEHQVEGAALRYACARGHLKTAALLLRFGADPQRVSRGQTPLMLARRRGWPALVELLQAAGASSDDSRARPVARAVPLAQFPLEGGCRCGQLRFRLQPPLRTEAVPPILATSRSLGVWQDQVQLLSGPDLDWSPSGVCSSQWSCQKCFDDLILWTPQAPECRYVRLRSLDDPAGALALQRTAPDQLYLSAPVQPRQLALHLAARAGDTRRVARLIARGWPVEVEIDGSTPLEEACASDYFRTARLLLRHGADVRRAEVFSGGGFKEGLPAWIETLIHHGRDPQQMLATMVTRGTPAAVKVLLRAGADLNLPDEEGTYPLLHAAHNGCAMLRCLMRAGADPRLQSQDGLHALGFCASFGFSGRARALLQEGFPVNLCEEGGQCSALITACGAGHVGTARVLLEQGADPNLGRLEVVPLMTAASRASLPLVRLLLQFGADPGRRDAEGKTAWDWSPAECQAVRDLLQSRDGS